MGDSSQARSFYILLSNRKYICNVHNQESIVYTWVHSSKIVLYWSRLVYAIYNQETVYQSRKYGHILVRLFVD